MAYFSSVVDTCAVEILEVPIGNGTSAGNGIGSESGTNQCATLIMARQVSSFD